MDPLQVNVPLSVPLPIGRSVLLRRMHQTEQQIVAQVMHAHAPVVRGLIVQRQYAAQLYAP